MDGHQFDALTRTLAAGASRRRILGGAIGAALASLGLRTGEAAPNRCAVGCAGLKGPQKAACKQACRQCGGDFSRVCAEEGPFGPVAFTCCPEGTFCVGGAGVCCEEGTTPCFSPDGEFTCCPAGTYCDFETGACPELAFCPDGTPAENCAGGVTADCEGGACAQVINVDGGCACVERACSFQACTIGAECESGLCVDIPGCCGEPNPFCGLPCGAGGEGVRSGGWNG